uniref:Uncharacterized protein n=1 Tax=Rhizophora mucronata TaxID=61149 RepID=A0A2P2NLH9_RHIMU
MHGKEIICGHSHQVPSTEIQVGVDSIRLLVGQILASGPAASANGMGQRGCHTKTGHSFLPYPFWVKQTATLYEWNQNLCMREKT